jgi:ribose/xylose/arabinose/galactoside ABC-type transport system permease subunit
MATAAPAAPPAWFRIAAALAVLWNAFGVFQYLGSVGLFGDPLASLPEAQRAAAEAIPAAVIAAFAIGTLAGLIGSLGLVLRKRWAVPALLVSLAALVVLEGYIVFLSDALEAFGGIALPLTIVLVAALLAWLAAHARRLGWLA